jgi:hypothetical protein
MRNKSAGPSTLSTLFLAAAVMLVGTALTVGGLWYVGWLNLPFLNRPRDAGPPEGTVPVYLSVKEIPAYTRVTREHLFDAAENPHFFHLPPADVEQRGLITDFSKILGRIVAHDFRPGVGFRDKDFLPEGTRPGIVGGTPPDKRALVLDAAKIQGIYALKAGDHFDLLATVLVEPVRAGGTHATIVGAPPASEPKKNAVVKPLVQNGVVVQPVAVRPALPGAAKKGQEKPPAQEIVIAVAPDEVAPLTQALAVGADIIAAYRSGQPTNGSTDDLTPGSPPPPPTTTIEVIQNGKRELLTFPAPPARAPAVTTSAAPQSPAR